MEKLLVNIFKVYPLYIVAYLLLMFHYIFFVSIYFEYEDFFLELNTFKIIISIIFLLFISIALWDLKPEKPSYHLYNILIFISIIPMLVLYSCKNLSSLYMIYTILSLYTIRLILNINWPFVRIKFINYKLLMLLNFIIAVATLLLLFYINKDYFNLDVMKVYEYRRIISQNTPDYIEYIYNIIFKGSLPIIYLFILFKTKKTINKIFFIVAFSALYIFIFGITSHKFFLFIIPFMTFIYLLFSRFRDISGFILLSFLTFLVIWFVLGFSSPNFYWFFIESLFIVRIIFVPANLNFAYYEFFKENPFIFFTDSKFILTHYFLEYPYDIDLAHLIGREIFNNPSLGANTGWIGSGFAQAGLYGMLIYSTIIGIVFKYLDFLSRYIDYRFIVISFFPYVIILFLSSDLKTVFLTHGFLLYLIFLSIFSIDYKRGRL